MTTETNASNNTMRLIVVGALVVGAFFGAYRFASAVSGRSAAANGSAGVVAGSPTGAATNGSTNGSTSVAAGSDASGSDAPACACCGSGQPTANGVSGDEVTGAATVAGDVQTVSVDLSAGTYAPNVIALKAGVPAEITFGQSGGCTAVVQSKDLGFQEDLTAGPKTVKLGALEPGTYAFSCGMEMVFGKIVVE